MCVELYPVWIVKGAARDDTGAWNMFELAGHCRAAAIAKLKTYPPMALVRLMFVFRECVPIHFDLAVPENNHERKC